MIFVNCDFVLFSSQKLCTSSGDIERKFVSSSAENGIIGYPVCSSIHSFNFFSHLLRWRIKSLSDIFIRNIAGFAVNNCSVFRTSIYLPFHWQQRICLPFSSYYLTRCRVSRSNFFDLSSPRLTTGVNLSMSPFTICKSFKISSWNIIYRSLIGSRSP